MSSIKIIDHSNDSDDMDAITCEHRMYDGMIKGVCSLYLDMIEKKDHLYNDEFVSKITKDVDSIIENQLLDGVIAKAWNMPAVRLVPATVTACLLHFNHIHIDENGLSGDFELLDKTICTISDEVERIFRADIEEEEHALRS